MERNIFTEQNSQGEEKTAAGFELLCGSADFDAAPRLPVLPPFSDAVLSLLGDVSQALLADKDLRAYPDVVSFAFFCRRAALDGEKQAYKSRIENRLGRGLSFHIAPGNVPTNFAYTLAAGLLAGCPCIVKAPSRPFPQVEILAKAFAAALQAERHAALVPYITLVRYGRQNAALTARLSALCAARVIWGGDDTVAEVRTTALLPPRAIDIAFADRWSFCFLAADAVKALDAASLKRLAHSFYNDTYLYDQNACSSPRLVLWCGDEPEAEAAKAVFWPAVRAAAASYPLPPVVAVDKLVAAAAAGIDLPGAWIEPEGDMLLTRVKLAELSESLPKYQCPGGFFLEYTAHDMAALGPLCGAKTQTVGCFGVFPEEIQSWLLRHGAAGVDRIVPIGQAAAFTLVWDGWDLPLSLSRIVSI